MKISYEYLKETYDVMVKTSTPLPIIKGNYMTKQPHAERAHAPLAPSSMKMYMNCLASLIPPKHPVVRKESIYADEGTLAHEYFEKVLNEGDHILKEIECEEMRKHVEDFTNLIKGIIKKVGEQNVMNVLIEQRVHYTENIFGTVDCAILYIKNGVKKAYILDLKYGAGVAVTAQDNEQLLTYLLATCKEHKWDAQEATIAIYQPRNFSNPFPLDQHLVTTKEIKDFDKRLRATEKKALKILNGNYKAMPKESPGDHCRWCPRKVVCKGYTDFMAVPALLELDALPEEPSKLTFPALEELTDEQLSRIIEVEADIKEFLNAVCKYVIMRCEQTGFPGYKLVPGKSQRQWSKDISVEDFAKALKSRGVSDPFDLKLKGIGAIEKEIGKNKIDDLVTHSTPSPKLVKASDPRVGLNNAVSLLDEIKD